MIALWVLICTFLSCAGWGLSAVGQLNETGYGIILVTGVAAGWCGRKKLAGDRFIPKLGCRLRHRAKRLFPAAFFGLTLLVVAGGILNAPSNYDGLAYRMPRILHWLAAEQWHWIHTDFQRLNTRATGYEWVATPIILFTHSIRPVIIVGLVSLLLLPGLVFSVFTRLGVHPRVAWHWMWLAPTGYCFVLQAGGIGNDVYGATLALAALHFALRARTSDGWSDFALAILAASLLTAAKTSNIPLLLPCVLALGSGWRHLWRRPLVSLGVFLVAAVASFLPIATMNYRACGDWTGARAEEIALIQGNPTVTVPGNLIVLPLQNLAPPIFPLAGKWNEHAPRFWPGDFHQKMRQNFEQAAANLALPEMQNEETAGLGLGLCLLVMASWLAGRKHAQGQSAGARAEVAGWIRWVRLAPLISVFAYLYKATFSTTARIFAPYYLVLLPLFLTGRGQVALCRQRWWRWVALGVFLVAGILVVLTPSRPLWPAERILGTLADRYPDHRLLQRALTVYSVYGVRANGLAPVRDKLPMHAQIVGLVTFDDLETSLWDPLGRRQFRHITTADSPETVREAGLHYAVLNGEWFPGRTGMTVGQWLETFNAEVAAEIPLRLRAGRGEFTWYIVRFK